MLAQARQAFQDLGAAHDLAVLGTMVDTGTGFQ